MAFVGLWVNERFLQELFFGEKFSGWHSFAELTLWLNLSDRVDWPRGNGSCSIMFDIDRLVDK